MTNMIYKFVCSRSTWTVKKGDVLLTIQGHADKLGTVARAMADQFGSDINFDVVDHRNNVMISCRWHGKPTSQPYLVVSQYYSNSRAG